MSDHFCTKCLEKDAQIELLVKRHYEEMQCMKQKLADANAYAEKLKSENEALSFDLAFYEGKITNLSCNGK